MIAQFNRGVYVVCKRVSSSFTTQCDELQPPSVTAELANFQGGRKTDGMQKRGQILKLVGSSWLSYCDEDEDDEDNEDEENSLDDLANEMKEEEADKNKTKPPKTYDSLMGTLSQGTVDAADGLRVIVQKQLSLNTVVTHNYTLGAHGGQESSYQYGLIQAFGTFEDGNQIQLNSDADMNLNGSATLTFNKDANIQARFQSGQQGTQGGADFNYTDSQSATQFQYNHEQGNNTFGLSYMQALGKTLQLGGNGSYSPAAGQFNRSFGGAYDDEENLIAAQFGGSVRFNVDIFFLLLPLHLFLSLYHSIEQNLHPVRPVLYFLSFLMK